MQYRKTTKPMARRDVLKLAPAIGVAAGTSGVIAARQEAAEPTVDPRQPRLADTKHIRTYYRLART